MTRPWTFLTNHAHVLLCISRNPDVLIREVAVTVGITERATQRIVAELEEAGYLQHEKVGRRNRYSLVADAHLRHPIESHVSIEALLHLLSSKV
jgi:DNA-binding IclR family transcriptional regulator